MFRLVLFLLLLLLLLCQCAVYTTWLRSWNERATVLKCNWTKRAKNCERKNVRTIKSRDLSYSSVNGTNRKLLLPDALSFTSSLCGIHAIINFEYFNNDWHDETNIKCADTVVRERKWRKRSNTFTCITHPRAQVPANGKKRNNSASVYVILPTTGSISSRGFPQCTTKLSAQHNNAQTHTIDRKSLHVILIP